jgi:porin
MNRGSDRTLRVSFFCVLAALLNVSNAECGSGPAASPDASPNQGLLEQIHASTEDRGLTLGAEYTGEVVANLTGGISRGATYEGLLRLSLKLGLGRLVGWNGATIYVSALDPHGEGISREHSGDLNIASNIDAYNGFRLYEFWFQQKLFGDALSIRVGQMSADQEFFLSTYSALFLNSGLGTMPTISFNNKLPVYPVGGLGIRLEYKPNDNFFYRIGIFDADPGIQNTTDKQGTAFRLNLGAGVILLGEAGYTRNSNPDSAGVAGTYKIGAWYDSSNETTRHIPGMHNSDCGFYLIVDQMLYRKAPDVSGPSTVCTFLRFSAAPQQERNLVPFYTDLGLDVTGPIPSREKDILGIAIGYTKLSDHFTPDHASVHSGHETVAEVSYKFQINDHLFFQPDLQYIFDPGGDLRHHNALVSALRFDFTY